MNMNDQHPAVSVIVATYQGAYLEETLQSILAQTFTNFEVLVLDDANESECRTLVEELRDGRLCYIANDSPLRPAMNHTRGIRAAKGENIIILNHDDLWAPDALARLTAALHREPTAVAAFSRARVADHRGAFDEKRTSEAWIHWDCTDYPTGLVTKWSNLSSGRPAIPAVPATLVRATTIKSIDIPEDVGGMYDAWIGYRVAHAGPVYHEDSPIGFWREHSDNLTHQRSTRRSFEPVAFDSRLLLDRALPISQRLAAARRLPRSIASWLKNYVSDRRNLARKRGRLSKHT